MRGEASEHVVCCGLTLATILHGLFVPGEHGDGVAAILSVERARLQRLPKHIEAELLGKEN